MDEQKSRIEKLQQKIDSQNFHASDANFEMAKKNYNIQDNWHTGNIEKKNVDGYFNQASVEPEEKSYGGFFKYVYGFAFLFFVLSIAYAAFIFIKDNQTVAGDDVSINIVGPVSVGGGEKLSLDVLVQNNNSVPIELVDLIIDYPEGTKSIDLSTDLRRSRETIGTVSSGTVVRKTISSALFGPENSSKEISASVEYRVQGSTAIFSKNKKFDIVLSASPIRISVSALKEISSGQDLDMELKIISNSANKLEKVAFSVEYPFGFVFKSSDVEPKISNNFWVFDALNPGEEKIIKIKGSIQGQNEEERVFKFKTGLLKDNTNDTIGVIFNTAIHGLQIQKSFVDLAINVGGESGKNIIIGSNKEISGELVFSNNTNDKIRNLNLELYLEGAVIDEKSISAFDGFYSSSENKIFWNSETSENFTEISPRDSFVLRFEFKTNNLKTGTISITNPAIKLRAGATGKRISTSNVEEKVETIASTDLKVQTDVVVNTYSSRDEEAFVNVGPVPPKVEVETNYNVVFEVSNNINNIKNARIETTLPSYIIYKNQFYPREENIYYDNITRKLVWNIGNMTNGEGYSKSSRKVYLNVSLIPSISQIGQSPLLVNKSKFNATDEFTGKNIELTLPNVTTDLYYNTGGNNQGNVVE